VTATLTRIRGRSVAHAAPRRVSRRSTSLPAQGEPMLWLTAGALLLALAMIAGLLALVVARGATTFWPGALVEIETKSGTKLLGEIQQQERFVPEDSATRTPVRRRMLRTGNFELSGTHYRWVSDPEVAREDRPEWALLVERESWGRFYGTPTGYEVDGKVVATDPEKVLALFDEDHPGARERLDRRRSLETKTVGALNREREAARLAARSVELAHPGDADAIARAAEESKRVETSLESRYKSVGEEIAELNRENARRSLVLVTSDGKEKKLALGDVVRVVAGNRLGVLGKLGVYASRWKEYLLDDPREANSEGGVFPAIYGTVAMTLIMSLLVVPFGVLAALYLREYAKPGPLVSAVRICVNNLAGVPSVVFGVFGLGFFCYLVGASIDQLLFSARLPNPTYGKGGILWASLTLALLTLPVVIVATEEALAAVPGSMREGSYGCGATKWQTIQRIVLPRAMPGILTGMILAIARGAGEVAPLMLVGAVKLAPELPIDGVAPFVHPERSFMHLGFHIFDLGFQSPNSEAAKPMVYTTTLLLIGIVVLLNVVAVWVRGRLRRRFAHAQI
jgi:phosphate transport system permease protein